MTIYSKVLIEVNKIGSLTTQHNNLMKLYYQTEDTLLKERLRSYCKEITKADRCNKDKMHLAAKNIISNNIHNKISLINYCEQMVMSEKPEWQIMAERNGWTPPNNWS